MSHSDEADSSVHGAWIPSPGTILLPMLVICKQVYPVRVQIYASTSYM